MSVALAAAVAAAERATSARMMRNGAMRGSPVGVMGEKGKGRQRREDGTGQRKGPVVPLTSAGSAGSKQKGWWCRMDVLRE